MTRLGIVFVIIKLHHLREVDLAPLNWNASIGNLSRGAWNMFFFAPLFDWIELNWNASIGNLSRGAWNMFFFAPLFDWVEITSVFPNSCWSNRLQALCDMLCLYQERSSKLKERRYLLTNHRKMIMCREHLRIAPKETHTVNNRCHSFSVLLTQQAYWYVWAQFFLWVKSQFRKRLFFPLTYNTNMPESNLFSRIDEGEIREKNDLKRKDLIWPDQYLFPGETLPAEL